MRLNLFLLVLSLQGNAVLAQTLFSSQLLDKDSKQTIPFATIKVLSKPYAINADSTGKFSVIASATDTLLISCVGYQSLQMMAIPQNVILLTRSVQELRPVAVGKKRVIKTETLGLKRKTIASWVTNGYGEEFAQRIDLGLQKNEYCQLKKVIIPSRHFSAVNPAALHVYSVDPQSGLPGKELLSKMYILNKVYYRKDRFVVDLTEENLYIDDPSVFICFSWLNTYEQKLSPNRTSLDVTWDLKVEQTYHRLLMFSDYTWRLASRRNGNPMNTLMKVEVDKYSFE